MNLARLGLRAFLLLLTCSGALALSGAPAATVRISGKEYVRVTDWARSNELEPRWIKKEHDLQLGNGSYRISLSVDSSDAQFNGIGLRLCYPLVLREGVPLLSQIDVESTFRPLFSPPINRAGRAVKSICIDPGHGGTDSGFRIGSNQEKKFTLLLAQELRDQLVKAGFKVSLTRTRDVTLDLPVRAEIAKNRAADLFISLHFNSAPSSASTVRGAEVYCMTPAGAPSSNARGEGSGAGWFPGNRLNDKNVCLAFNLQKSLAKELGVEDRGMHRARFQVLREATMPAVLIEGGFMSHPVEGRKIFDAVYRKQMAHAILDGVLAYKRQVEPKSSR
ncbi:MAG TPA: N-acetylmuramoyl-L-alanine amidase [Candidatus Dormibacteraeota bacterium]|nr:N-acetylmuramoyl-L-alanine amidase [Candidatus Dormibacteraeota bacterium]